MFRFMGTNPIEIKEHLAVACLALDHAHFKCFHIPHLEILRSEINADY